jgi:hypothetical protein
MAQDKRMVTMLCEHRVGLQLSSKLKYAYFAPYKKKILKYFETK